MTQHHPIRWIILLALPLVLLLGWFVVEQSPSWFSAVPAWLRPTSPDAVTGACEALAAVAAYGGSFDGDLPSLGLTAPDALAAAREAAATAYGENLPPSACDEVRRFPRPPRGLFDVITKGGCPAELPATPGRSPSRHKGV